MIDLKKYDSLLDYKRNLDGSMDIFRQSPFSIRKKHKILTIKNQFVGSGRWILNKLMTMDTQKFDIAGSALKKNARIQQAKNDRISRDIGEFMYNGEKIAL